MQITNFSVHHRTTVVVLLVMIVTMGLTAYVSLPRESAPELKIPNVLVSVYYEGASPSDMESLVTRPIERKLQDLTEIRKLNSTSSEGSCFITAEFDPDIDIDTAVQKVRDKVDEAEPDLPTDLPDPPWVQEILAADLFPVMYVALSGAVGPGILKDRAEDLKDEIEAVPGVLEAEISGDLEREVQVEFSARRVSAYGLTMREVIQAVNRNNLDTPAGALDIGEARYGLKVPGEIARPDEVENLVISVRNGKPIYLRDISSVRSGFKDRKSYSRVNGRDSIILRVTKRQGQNLLEIASKVRGVAERFEENSPDPIELTITSDGSEEIEQMVADLENNILTGLVLVLAVIFLALGLRDAVLVSLAIPLSMLIAFFIIQTMGITLNMVVLFSLILALGMLVDNGIVLVENIHRHHVSLGKSKVQAALDGSSEVAWPVVTSTTTTVVAFLPLVFWPGMMGQFMGYLPKTVIIVLISSLFVALVITPPLCVIFMKQSTKDRGEGVVPKGEGYVVKRYRQTLSSVMEYPFLSFAFATFTLVLAIWTFAKSGLGMEMFPETEPSRIVVDITAPDGTNVDKTNDFAKQAEASIAKFGNIRFVTTSVGEGAGMDPGPNKARITIDLVKRENRIGQSEAESRPGGSKGLAYFQNSKFTLRDLRKDLTTQMVGVEIKVDKEADGPNVGAPVNVEIHGEDYTLLSELAEQVRTKLATIPGVVDLRDDYVSGLPEVSLEIDKTRAALMGLDAESIGQMVKAAVNGIRVGNYRIGDEEYDITARLPLERRDSFEDITQLMIPNSLGHSVPLTSLARVERKTGLASIKHIDGSRVVTVSSNLASGFNTQEVLGQVRTGFENAELPRGVEVKFTGENEEYEKTQTFMLKALVAACLLIALVMVTQFDSMTQPMMILASVIMSFIGVFVGLLVTRTSFGVVMTGMGVVSLAGVVVNNAIVLIDYTNQLRSRGMSCREAILEAGGTRLRPVLLTAITTILGLLPMALGVSFDFRTFQFQFGSESSQYWGAMAVAVIFGLMVATVMTLFLIPTVYQLRYGEKRKKEVDWVSADLEEGVPT